jgi:methoxymalonate biosynthesis acyl carrier protein
MELERIKGFVQENLIKNKNGTELRETDDWLANGLVDSIGVIQIVSFVERELNTPIPEEDVTVDNFKSLKDIAKYLEQRKVSRVRPA